MEKIDLGKLRLQRIKEELAEIDSKINLLTLSKNKLLEEQLQIEVSRKLKERLSTNQSVWAGGIINNFKYEIAIIIFIK